MEETSTTEVRYEVGHQVGDLARHLYDPDHNGVLIDPQRDGFDVAFKQTSDLLSSFKPIFEASFSAAGGLALADIMLPINKRGKPRWRMIEVKSSTSIKDYHRDDVAIQAFIARKSGLDLERIELACIDSSWIYPGKENYQGLLKETDLSEEAFGRGEEVNQWIKDAQAIVNKKREPKVLTGVHCDNPYSCGFYEYCAKKELHPKYPVSWLPRIQSKALKTLVYEGGISDLRDVPDEILNPTQLRVKRHTLSGKAYFDAKGALEDLSAHKLPAYFLDFETIQFAIPVWKGTRPYQLVPFQFSLHKMSRNGNLTHLSFLDLSGKDPSKPFSNELVRHCGVIGPIYAYNAGFESARIKGLAAEFPRLKKRLLAINDRLVDLMVIARERYYHPSQCGSWSLKKVLPAIAPDLHYDELDGVQDGGMAMDVFSEAIASETTSERKVEIEKQLLDYCELDTTALVRLWRFFMERKMHVK
jgi:hypothetical protein